MTLVTRYAGLPRRVAWLILAALLAMTALAAIFSGGIRVYGDPGKLPITDAGLYTMISDSVAKGEDYHVAAIRLQRLHNYPVQPSVTVRLPTLAWTQAALGSQGSKVAIVMLMAIAAFAWYRRLRSEVPFLLAACAALLIAFSAGPFVVKSLIKFHQSWSSLLAAIALALWRPGRPLVAIGFALAAALVREFAFPLLAMMCGAALLGKRWREAGLWGAAMAVALAAYALHAAQVSALIGPGDAASSGWVGFGGWAMLAGSLHSGSILTALPASLSCALFVLSLFGWASWKAETGLWTFGWLLGMALMVAIFARPDNFYWVVMLVPLLLAGLVFVPKAVTDLWVAARRR